MARGFLPPNGITFAENDWMMNREKEIISVTLWGGVANLLLCIFKMLSGVLGRSSAMVADAVHSISDFASDIIVLVMFRIAGKERDKSHDYGHGKFETLATLAVSLLLLVVGARLMAGSITGICSVFRGGRLASPEPIAFWAAIVSIAVKEALYQWTVRVGKKQDSQAVIANAWHHRSDALTSVGSALGIGGAIILGGKWTVLDPAAGCVLSIVIVVVAVKMAIPAFAELVDASLPDETEDRILGVIRSVPGVVDAHDLKTRRMGPDIIADVHMVVRPDMSVLDAHTIATSVEKALRSEFGEDVQISIHIEPDVDAE